MFTSATMCTCAASTELEKQCEYAKNTQISLWLR